MSDTGLRSVFVTRSLTADKITDIIVKDNHIINYRIYKQIIQEDRKMSATIVTKDNFDAEVVKSDIPVVLDFWATWCGPCQLQSPELEKFARANEGKIKTAKINVDEQPELAAQFGVQSIPTLVLVKDGTEAKRVVGLQNEAQLAEQFLG